MAEETLVLPEDVAIDLEGIRSRLKKISELWSKLCEPSVSSDADPKQLFDDCSAHFQEMFKQIDSEDQNVASMGLEALDEYMKELKKEIRSAEEENLRISTEIDTLTRAVVEDTAQLGGNIEALTCSLKFFDSKALHYLSSSYSDGQLPLGEIHENPAQVFHDYKIEILELDQRIQKNKVNLNTLQDLDYALKRVEAIEQIEQLFSDIRVLGFHGSCIRLSLKTPIPASDGLLLRHKLNCVIEPSVLEHELLIEVAEGTEEPKSLEIFPGDVSVDGIIDSMKLSSDFMSSISSSWRWCIRQVQHRIVLCTLRRILVKDANKSRHSFEYLDKDDMIKADVVGGVITFIKLAKDWPISSSPLKLVSVKSPDHHSKSISLSFLCKVKELTNSLDMVVRLHLVRFVDAIEEILVREMQSELHSDSIAT